MQTGTETTTGTSPAESRAFMAALNGVAPDASTACAEWTAHDLVAHLAAGAEEIAELIEDRLANKPPRPTRAFDEREAPFAELPDDQLRQAMVHQSRRKIAATQALSTLGGDATFEFTGRPFTAVQLETHSRSEAALHRWDLIGDDEVGDELLAQPELTRHAVEVLNTLPVLNEAPGTRAAAGGLFHTRVVLRSPDQPDVVLIAEADGARFELIADGPADGDAIVATDAVNRLLSIWGRRSGRRQIGIVADPGLWSAVAGTLWPSAVCWPPG
jgi:uncharacterized protein (TIGR03083 family)